MRGPRGTPSRSATNIGWEVFTGMAVPPGLQVCHTCDHPWCQNPGHWFLGTNAENIADRVAKGRPSAPSGERNGRSKLTWGQVREIRARWTGRHGQASALAREYGVADTQIHGIVRGRTWKEGDAT